MTNKEAIAKVRKHKGDVYLGLTTIGGMTWIKTHKRFVLDRLQFNKLEERSDLRVDTDSNGDLRISPYGEDDFFESAYDEALKDFGR